MSHIVIIQDNILKSDSNIKILKVLEESKIFRIIGKLTYRLITCSYCHQQSMVKNGFKIVCIRDIPFNNKSVIIQLTKQHFLCCACCHSITTQTKLVDKNAQISKRLRIPIITKLVKDTSVENMIKI